MRRIAARLRAFKEKAVSAARRHPADAVGGAGIASLAAGAGMIYVPAGFIVLGALLLAISIGLDRDGAKPVNRVEH